MSLYLGEYNNKKILHIAKGSHDIAVMKAGILNDTVFHSDLGYVFVKYFPVTYVNSYTVNSIQYYVYRIPTEFFDEIVGTTRGYTVLTNGNAQMSQLNINISGLATNEPYSPVYFRSDTTSTAAYSSSVNSRYGYFHFTSLYSSVILTVALLDDSGYIYPYSDGTTDIVVNSGLFKVNGVTLNNYGYISPAQVNTRDVYTSGSIAEDGGIQFVNSNISTITTMGIISRPGYSAVTSNGYDMFSTVAQESYNRYKTTVLTEFVYGSLYVCGPGGDGSTSRLIATDMKTNQLFTCRKVSTSSLGTVAINEYLQFYAFVPGTSVVINRTYVGYPAYAWTYMYIDMGTDMTLRARMRFTVGGRGCGRSTYAAVKTNIMDT